MILFPAIDMRGGKVVRLLHGDFGQETVYAEDPLAQAQSFAAQGLTWLHLVDLDGAAGGEPKNAAAVEAIRAALPHMRIQLGGGIRSAEQAARWLDLGLERIILGTVALRDPDLVRALAKAYAGRVAVGLDARDGRVAVEGWLEVSETRALDLAQAYEDAGVAALIYTDIARDGALSGVNLEATAELASAVSIPVIASGGVASLEDVRALKALAHPGIEGVISGRALYDGRLDAAEAQEVLAA